MKIEDLYRQVIMGHAKNPKNKSKKKSPFKIEEEENPSCGDEVIISVLIKNEIIKEIYWDGNGCNICCSSASIMTDELEGLTIEKAAKKIIEFNKMVRGEKYNKEIFEEAIVYENLKNFPTRIKCATISWNTSLKILTK